MNILFINPPNIPFTDSSILIEPIDIITIATIVKNEGFFVDIIDMDVDKMLSYNLKKNIHNKNYDYAVIVYDYHIPLHTNEAFSEIINISKVLKENWINVILIWKIATYNPEMVLNEGSHIDICISNNAEKTLVKLFKENSLEKSTLENISNISFYNNWFIKTKSLNINNYCKFPIPDRSLLDLNKYIDVRTILSSRWCPSKCSFCHVPWFWWNWQAKEANLVVDEIEYLIKKHNAKKILFLDDNATVDKNRMNLISKYIIERWIKVKLWCLWTIKSFDEDSMKLMYNAWFRWIHYWIETGDEDISKKINKNLKNEKIISIINKTKEIWFKVRTSWILDLNIESIDSTIDLIKTLKTDEIRLHFLSIRFWSVIYNNLNNKGVFPIQYIHTAVPKSNTSEILTWKIKKLTDYLESDWYQLLKNTEENKCIESGKKTVSLCPLKYWINW